MLNTQDLRFTFDTFRLNTIFYLLPFEWRKDGRMRMLNSRKRWILYKCFLFNGILYYTYVSLRLLQSILLPAAGRTSVITMVPHGILFAALTIPVVSNLQMYLLSPAMSTVVFNDVVTLLESAPRKRKKNFSDITVQALPFICLYFSAMPLVNYVVRPESYQTVYSLLYDINFRSIWLILVCALYEYATFLYFLVTTYNVLGLVVFFFFRATADELKAMVENLSSIENQVGRETILQYVQALRSIQLRITYFNRVYAYMIHIIKLECMFDGVLGLFIFIKLWDSNPIVAAFGICIGTLDCYTYVLMYGRAYEIPQYIKDYKDQVAILSTRSIGNEDERREIRQLLRSIPELGIKVGEFHELEQATEVKYFEFVIGTVVDLLLTFPGPLKL